MEYVINKKNLRNTILFMIVDQIYLWQNSIWLEYVKGSRGIGSDPKICRRGKIIYDLFYV